MNRHLNQLETTNFMPLLARFPAAAKAYAQAEQALASGYLTRQQREQIALAVAEINNSAPCLEAHAASARSVGLSQEDIRLARQAAANEPKTDAMLRFTLFVALQRGDIEEDDLRAVLKAGFSQAEVVEIIANIALNLFANYLNIVFRRDLEPNPKAALVNSVFSSQAA